MILAEHGIDTQVPRPIGRQHQDSISEFRRIAISLHAVNDKVRSEIMPINNKYPIDELMTACKNYAGIKNSRKITFEYILLIWS